MAENLSMALAELLRKADAEPDRGHAARGCARHDPGTDGAWKSPSIWVRSATSAVPIDRVNATATASGPGIRAWAHLSCGYRASGMAASFRDAGAAEASGAGTCGDGPRGRP